MHSNLLRVQDIREQVISHIPEAGHGPKFAQLRQFINHYLDNLDNDDLQVFDTEDLYGAAVAHWELSQRRQAGESLVRVYNPEIAEHGWQSGHTVIEVVTDDVPHLVGSVSMAVSALNLNNHQLIHPVMHIQRSPEGELISVGSQRTEATENESLMHFEIDRVSDSDELNHIRSEIRKTISFVKLVRDDHQAMQLVLQSLKDDLSLTETDHEAGKFVAWLDDHHFTLLGTCTLSKSASGEWLLDDQSCLGILGTTNIEPQALGPFPLIDPESTVLGHDGRVLGVSKASLRSPMLRPEILDVISIRECSENSEDNLRCLIGLFSPFVKHLETQNIPVLASKIASIQKNSGSSLNSHFGKSLQHTLESFPRDLLFQSDTETLMVMATGIINLQERLRIRLFGYLSPGATYANCLVFIPHEYYSRELRLAIESILQSDLGGVSSDFESQFSSESALARIHYVVQLQQPVTGQPDWSAIEARITQAAITWDDRLKESLMEQHDEEMANKLFRQYRNAFPSSYKEDYSARIACADISFMENEVPEDRPVMSFYRNILADSGTVNFKLFSPTSHVALSDVIPVIENMGMKVDAEHPFQVKRVDQVDIWIHEFTVQHIDGKDLESSVPNQHIQQAFEQIWTSKVENDGFNRLILDAGIDWQQTTILRSYCKYLLQIRVPFSQEYMIDTLVSNARIAKLLIVLFEQRFNPEYGGDRIAAMSQTVRLIKEALIQVDSLDQDRILRAYLNLIEATLRTNYFRSDEAGKPLTYLSFKIESGKIDDLPLPRPLYEIFVYSPKMEGIHLRGGKVARGGLRWSDRREDFRTEVLGLMKAQMVKNAVIVPVGSKGGFYVKKPPVDSSRDAQLAEGIECYKTFLRGLLDITDNISGESIVTPDRVVRYDDDDPYLVVAADKGTATFSDHANDLAQAYGFWLGDAFASGGSVGYDHKKMGITAKGAWESVKRHFRELGIDTQTTEFTVVGIGDMAGDVFGNGMLLSEHIQLVAAFNHQHIFIDPTPDCEASFQERQRIFDLPRSTWSDYDTGLLSEGGEIYARSSKEITLSSQAMQVLDIDNATMTPNELIHRLLQAPVDLIWNGGIGTYVKASEETHALVNDRANDSVRVDAEQMRCRVFGEGGNLGATQLGRVILAQRDVMLFTDAIDNSAGVDCSDHEVNIKILVNSVVENGDMTLKQRDRLLAEMTDQVETLVLRDNYLQTQCINTTHWQAAQDLEEHSRFITTLESAGKLDRNIEYLPQPEEIAERLGNDQGLTRPELAVLVSYSKMTINDDLLESTLPEDPALVRQLVAYFPHQLTANYQTVVEGHRLRREIIATSVTNALVNRLGPTFTSRIVEELGCSIADVAKAFIAACEIFNMDQLWSEIEALDNKVSADNQTSMLILVSGLVERAVHWLIRSRRTSESIDSLVNHFKPGITELIHSLPDALADANRKTLEERCHFFTSAGTPDEIARRVAAVVPLSSALDIVEISNSSACEVADVATVYFELGAFLNLQWLRDEISGLVVRTHWHNLAKSELRSDIHYQQRHLCAEVLSTKSDATSASSQVKHWSESNKPGISKYSAIISDMKASPSVDFAMLSLAVNEVHKLLRSDRPLAS